MDIQWVQWLVAAGTTAFVAGVGFVQWRTAQQKAVLDLFDRRYAIYEVVRRSVGTLYDDPGKFVRQQKQQDEFEEAVERAYFFFGDDVCDHLIELRFRVRTLTFNFLSYEDDPPTTSASDATISVSDLSKGYHSEEAWDVHNLFHTVGRPLFGRYMRFSQTVPIGLWATTRRNIAQVPVHINAAWREWVLGRSYSGRVLRRSWRKSRTRLRAYSGRKPPSSAIAETSD